MGFREALPNSGSPNSLLCTLFALGMNEHEFMKLAECNTFVRYLQTVTTSPKVSNLVLTIDKHSPGRAIGDHGDVDPIEDRKYVAWSSI